MARRDTDAESSLRLAVGHGIRSARKAKDLTQADLAEHVGLSENFVQRIEVGEAFPSIQTLKRIRDVLSVSSDDILRGRTEYPDDLVPAPLPLPLPDDDERKELLTLIMKLPTRYYPMLIKVLAALKEETSENGAETGSD